MKKIAITAISSLSALGNNSEEVWENYLSNSHFLSFDHEKLNVWMQKIPQQQLLCSNLQKEDLKYKSLDKTVLYAIEAARNAIAKSGWQPKDNFGINIGSSRGATALFEKHYQDFLESKTTAVLASPTTTLGNISSWVAHDLQSQGPEISHSITCSTSLHALLNGVAWLNAGMSEKFLIGGSEAPLTPFTIAQMQALKIYSKASSQEDYPCLAGDFLKTKNALVLGEGAAMCCLEIEAKNPEAYILGIGYATEVLESNTSISTEADCFQKSMKMALTNFNNSDIDVIVMHAPGTIKGDLSEMKAIEKIFGTHLPLLTTNKWKIGHTFGASGIFSLEMAVLMLKNQTFIGTLFSAEKTQPKAIKKIMINAVGFGGNAVSVVIGF
jgi:3-oxoacyl-(acyl-carrier-protein) synthase